MKTSENERIFPTNWNWIETIMWANPVAEQSIFENEEKKTIRYC